MYDYDYSYYDAPSSYDTAELAGLGAFLGIFVLIAVAIAIFFLVCEWKIFKKAKRPGWYSIVPFLNMYTLYEMTWGNGWYFLLMFVSIIPGIGALAALAVNIITCIKLAKAYGKETGFGIGLAFLNVVFIPILAFDSSEYIGAPVDGILNPSEMKETTVEDGAKTTYANTNTNTATPNEPVTPAVTPTQENITYCKNCGSKLTEKDVFCPGCGTKRE